MVFSFFNLYFFHNLIFYFIFASNLKIFIMIHIFNIKIKINLSILGSLSIEKSEAITVPHAIILHDHLYVKSCEYINCVTYAEKDLSVSDYISILMDNRPDNIYYIAYV